MANVVVLTPPAVPPGEPPINIRIAQNSLDSVCNAPWETVQNPAVLVVTDWNMEAISFWPMLSFPMVSGFLYSARNTKTVPAKIRSTVIITASLDCSRSLVNHQRFGTSPRTSLRLLSITSNQTVKPIPLKMISRIVVTLMIGLVT